MESTATMRVLRLLRLNAWILVGLGFVSVFYLEPDFTPPYWGLNRAPVYLSVGFATNWLLLTWLGWEEIQSGLDRKKMVVATRWSAFLSLMLVAMAIYAIENGMFSGGVTIFFCLFWAAQLIVAVFLFLPFYWLQWRI